MEQKYIQIGYHTPFNVNSSIDFIVTSETPITEVSSHINIPISNEEGKVVAVLTDDINHLVDLNDLDYNSSNVSIITSNDEYNIFKVMNAKIELDDSFDNNELENNIRRNFSIDNSDNLVLNIEGLTISEYKIFNSTENEVVE